MGDTTVKVLYIAGAGRSGSTILSNILGEIPGFFNVGEIAEICNTRLQAVSTCGCGVPVKNCRIWQQVFEKFKRNECFTGIDDLSRYAERLAHSRNMALLVTSKRIKSYWQRCVVEYLENLSALYRAVAEVTGCRVIVDASKNVGYAYLLKCVAGIDLYVAHLVRDSRPAVYSWLNEKAGLWRENPYRASVVWATRNMFAEMLGWRLKRKYIRIRYEDLVREPGETLSRILNRVNAGPPEIPFQSSHEIRLGVNHSIFGNPDRFKRGIVRLASRDGWKRMRPRYLWLITVITWPLLLHYGYPLKSSRPDGHLTHKLSKA